MLAMPDDYFRIAPDLRGYGDTEDLVIDATRGARDWSDALLAKTGLSRGHMPRLVEGSEVSGGVRAEICNCLVVIVVRVDPEVGLWQSEFFCCGFQPDVKTQVPNARTHFPN